MGRCGLVASGRVPWYHRRWSVVAKVLPGPATSGRMPVSGCVCQPEPAIRAQGTGHREWRTCIRDGREPEMSRNKLKLGDVLRVGRRRRRARRGAGRADVGDGVQRLDARSRRRWPPQPLRAAAHAHEPVEEGHRPRRHPGRQGEPRPRWPDQPPGADGRHQPGEEGLRRRRHQGRAGRQGLRLARQPERAPGRHSMPRTPTRTTTASRMATKTPTTTASRTRTSRTRAPTRTTMTPTTTASTMVTTTTPTATATDDARRSRPRRRRRLMRRRWR